MHQIHRDPNSHIGWIPHPSTLELPPFCACEAYDALVGHGGAEAISAFDAWVYTNKVMNMEVDSQQWCPCYVRSKCHLLLVLLLTFASSEEGSSIYLEHDLFLTQKVSERLSERIGKQSNLDG